jgi:hypothetical protein
MKVKNQIVCFQDRGKWKEAVGKAEMFCDYRKFSVRIIIIIIIIIEKEMSQCCALKQYTQTEKLQEIGQI